MSLPRPGVIKQYKQIPMTTNSFSLHFRLLTRVWRFRGANKEKGEMNAASWFTRPVDVNDVPDYYQIVKKPMDFSTIKKKLEVSDEQRNVFVHCVC